MNFLAQLLPGLREVRAPLISGYLWLFAAWLLLASHLPTPGDGQPYGHVFDVAGAIGQVGVITVASVAAYLVGSLFAAVPGWVSYNCSLLVRRVRRGKFRPPPYDDLPRVEANSLATTRPFFAPRDFRGLDGDHRTAEILDDLARERLGKARQLLSTVLVGASAEVRGGAESTGNCTPTDLTAASAVVDATGDPGIGWSAKSVGAMIGSRQKMREINVSVPSFSASRDIFGERKAIQIRMMETANEAGSEVERLYSEAGLRFAVAPPLAVLAIILTVTSVDFWWLLLLPISTGLGVHGVVLRKHAGRELAHVLRSRPGFEDLDQITPVFVRYEQAVKKLIDRFSRIQWRELGASAIEDPDQISAPLSSDFDNA